MRAGIRPDYENRLQGRKRYRTQVLGRSKVFARLFEKGGASGRTA